MKKEKLVVPESIVPMFRDGKLVDGVFHWTPTTEEIDPELVYIPDATEFIPAPQLREPRRGKAAQITAKELSGHELKELAKSPAPLKKVGPDFYTGGCDFENGNNHYENDCAHFLSNAFIRAGYTELLTSGLISARDSKCSSSSRRPIRAYDMLKWFQKMETKFLSGPLEPDTGTWAVYQEKPGWKHVLIFDTDE